MNILAIERSDKRGSQHTITGWRPGSFIATDEIVFDHENQRAWQWIADSGFMAGKPNFMDSTKWRLAWIY